MVAETPVFPQAIAPEAAREGTAHRFLGLIGMVTSPFMFLSFAANGFSQGDSNQLGAALGFLFSLGWFCTILGLWRLGATGRRWPSRLLLGAQLVTVPLAIVFQVYEFVAPGSASILYTITDICWPLSMLLLLITGIVAIFARAFDSWLRFTPLLAALWLPVGIAAMGILGAAGGQAISGLHTAIGWALLGYAVYCGGVRRT